MNTKHLVETLLGRLTLTTRPTFVRSVADVNSLINPDSKPRKSRFPRAYP